MVVGGHQNALAHRPLPRRFGHDEVLMVARVGAAPMAERFQGDGEAGPFERLVQKAVVEADCGKRWLVGDEPAGAFAIAVESETRIAPPVFVRRSDPVDHERGHEQAPAG